MVVVGVLFTLCVIALLITLVVSENIPGGTLLVLIIILFGGTAIRYKLASDEVKALMEYQLTIDVPNPEDCFISNTTESISINCGDYLINTENITYNNDKLQCANTSSGISCTKLRRTGN